METTTADHLLTTVDGREFAVYTDELATDSRGVALPDGLVVTPECAAHIRWLLAHSLVETTGCRR